ncbi:PadR family transcriptional regulator [Microbispora rosea]|uniref:PadR family transcriptional regulator n=1 Tax=Microbispora rosea TaxID=58117 RepID=UPI0037A14CC2
MASPARITGPTLDVLEAFLAARARNEDLHGWAIAKATGRSSPTVYGVLDRLEDAGWVEGAWEEQAPDVNRPRRRLYRLTCEGAVRASALLAERRPGSVLGVLRSPPRLLLQGLYAALGGRPR